MIISQARIMLSNESYPNAPFPPVFILENDDDKLVDCLIEGGAIVARKDVWFSQCIIAGEKPTILGVLPPGSAANVHSCKLTKTKLPDAYYSMCYFQEE